MTLPMSQFQVWGKDNIYNDDGPLLVEYRPDLPWHYFYGYSRPIKRLPLTDEQKSYAYHREEYRSGLDS